MFPSFRSTGALFALLVFAACGSATSDDAFGRGQPQTTESKPGDVLAERTDAGALASDAGAVREAAAPPTADASASSSCQALLAQIDQLRPNAAACSFTDPGVQCAQSVADVCCPLFVTSKSTQATKSFIAAVEALRKSKCKVDCQAIDCSSGPSLCLPSSGARGSCQQ